MSSDGYAPYITKTGIFDSNDELSPLAAANKVFIPYCSSDGWSGNRAASNDTYGWHFRGAKIVEGVLNTLQSDLDLGVRPQNLVFGGCSAGGRGSMINLDYVMGILESGTTGNSNINLVGVLDSAMMVDIEPYVPTVVDLAYNTALYYNMTGSEYRVAGSKCGEIYSAVEDRWKCLFGQYKLPTIETPFLVNGNQYDAF